MKRSSHLIKILTNVFFNTFSVLLFLAAFSVFAVQKNQIEQQDQVVPVVNANNNQLSISKNVLSGMFKMRLRRWKDGSAVIVFVLPDDNPLHIQFCKQILQVFPHQMRRIWDRAVFSGSGQAPIILENIEEMISKIASTPGAIGYLKSSQLTEDIRILEIR